MNAMRATTNWPLAPKTPDRSTLIHPRRRRCRPVVRRIRASIRLALLALCPIAAAIAEPPRVPLALPGEAVSVPWQPGNAAGFQMGTSEEHGVVAAKGSLTMTVYRPEGTGPSPFVLLLHGCTDLHDDNEWRGWVEPWATLFRERGVGTAVIESLRPRGVERVCGDRAGTWAARRADDAYSAYEWLSGQAFVDPDRVALMGMSNGGRAALAALRPASPHARTFRAGVAFYPVCRDDIDSGFYAPLLVLIGDADTIAPAADCERLRQRPLPSAPELNLVVYPGAGHVFDVEWPGQPQSDAERAARIDARRQVLSFLTAQGVIPSQPAVAAMHKDG
jgi:dienelactone hydrolase